MRKKEITCKQKNNEENTLFTVYFKNMWIKNAYFPRQWKINWISAFSVQNWYYIVRPHALEKEKERSTPQK